MTTATSPLTAGFVVTRYESTTTGYYFIELTSEDGTHVATIEQTGQGGQNLYTHYATTDGSTWHGDEETFGKWMAEQIPFTAKTMRDLDFEDLAEIAEARSNDYGNEWMDIVAMAICDAIETRKVRKQRRPAITPAWEQQPQQQQQQLTLF